ncbi:MAG: DUF4830 domain-containing protein [Clostridia bacterium]|nr:DUF4830 domain-containing protein [Clostridia bacterium]
MFVYSVRASALRFVSVIVLSVIALAALIAFVPTYVPASVIVKENSVTVSGIRTEEDRIGFLKQFGWEVAGDAPEAVEVTVPARFDKVCENYNAIQKAQGMDLSRYRGKKVMRYTYTLASYPGYDGTVLASILVYKNKVIGGDICSADVTGFLHGFKK